MQKVSIKLFFVIFLILLIENSDASRRRSLCPVQKLEREISILKKELDKQEKIDKRFQKEIEELKKQVEERHKQLQAIKEKLNTKQTEIWLVKQEIDILHMQIRNLVLELMKLKRYKIAVDISYFLGFLLLSFVLGQL